MLLQQTNMESVVRFLQRIMVNEVMVVVGGWLLWGGKGGEKGGCE